MTEDTPYGRFVKQTITRSLAHSLSIVTRAIRFVTLLTTPTGSRIWPSRMNSCVICTEDSVHEGNVWQWLQRSVYHMS
jgi:hypothetical protein